MNLPKSSGAILPLRQLDSEFVATVPWRGVQALARFWTGTGSFIDWLVPSDWDIELGWSHEKIRARVAEMVLLHFERNRARHLPRHAGEWLDLIGQQLHRQLDRVDYPSAHTDWSATLSEFGRFPSPLYVERRPVASYDTPFTRLLKWTAREVRRAETVVFAEYGRQALKPDTRARLESPLELAEVLGAADQVRLSAYDVDVCRASGGSWRTLSDLAEELAALWSNDPVLQLKALAPILPQFSHQLFELGTLGLTLDAISEAVSKGSWITRNPLAGGRTGEPCFELTLSGFHFEALFQTVPSSSASPSSVYRQLAGALGGGSLRPDIWLIFDHAAAGVELVVECKFSLDAGYVISGITQSLAYSAEFPLSRRRRIHVTVGPPEVVTAPVSWGGRFIVSDPVGLATLAVAIVEGQHDMLMDQWRPA